MTEPAIHSYLSIRPEWLESHDSIVIAAYAEDSRCYHDLDHITTMLTWAKQLFRPAFTNATSTQYRSLVCAIIFHDIVYDVSRADNEERSADMAVAVVGDLCEPDLLRRLIMCTAGHRPILDPKTIEDRMVNVMIDLDLLVLSFDRQGYDRYAYGIYFEYGRGVDITEYAKRRIGFLEGFLERQPIFTGEALRLNEAVAGSRLLTLFDDHVAKRNLRFEIESLRENPRLYLNLNS